MVSGAKNIYNSTVTTKHRAEEGGSNYMIILSTLFINRGWHTLLWFFRMYKFWGNIWPHKYAMPDKLPALYYKDSLWWSHVLLSRPLRQTWRIHLQKMLKICIEDLKLIRIPCFEGLWNRLYWSNWFVATRSGLRLARSLRNCTALPRYRSNFDTLILSLIWLNLA